MWTNISGKEIPENKFSFNHFCVLLPLNVDAKQKTSNKSPTASSTQEAFGKR